jgi:His/Glu/Gln/Arg/opine family amino acid ABC transporter permease subunit
MEIMVRVLQTLPLLLDGLAATLSICLMGMIAAVGIAMPLVLARRSNIRFLQILAWAWVALMRGLPIVILVFLLYFGVPALLGLGRVSAYWVGVLALALNGSAFLSEVLRAAISQVNRGQWDAAASLGLSKAVTWTKVIGPQALRIALPAIVGEMTFLVKASPVLSLITVVDLTRRSQQVAMQTFDPLVPMLAAALLYFIVLYSLSQLSRLLERHLALMERRT